MIVINFVRPVKPCPKIVQDWRGNSEVLGEAEGSTQSISGKSPPISTWYELP